MAPHRPPPGDGEQRAAPPCAVPPPPCAVPPPPPPPADSKSADSAVPALRAAPPPRAPPLSAGCGGGGAAGRSGNGLPGSRRHRRWERNNFVGNPHVVFPAKFDTSSFPGVPYDAPRFHFSCEFIRQLAAQCAAAPPPTTAAPRETSRLRRRRAARLAAELGPPAAPGGGALGGRLRRTLRRSAPQGFLLAYEVPLKFYVELLLKRAAEDAAEALQAGRPGGSPFPGQDPADRDDGAGGPPLASPRSESSFEFCDGSDTSEPVMVPGEDDEWESGDVLGMLGSLCLGGAAALRLETGGPEACDENVAPGPLCNVFYKLLPERSGPLKTLVVEIENPFCRYVFHAMCAYYSLHSYSSDTAEGKRQTYVRWAGGRGKKKLVVPRRSFYEWLFASRN